MELSLRPYLCTFGGCGTHCPAEDLLDDIWQQADRNKQDDAEPGRTAGQHLHENVVHPLVVQEGPEQKQEREKIVILFTYSTLRLYMVLKQRTKRTIPNDASPEKRENNVEK